MPTKDCGLCDLVINCGASVGDRDQFQTGTVRLLCELVDNLRSFPFTDLVWASFAQLTTPAVNDWLLISDTSDGGVSKKISYADLFDSPPDNGVSLGGALNGFTNLYLTNGTHDARLYVSSNVLAFSYDATPYLWLNNTALAPWAQSLISLGTASYGYSAAYFANDAGGSVKGVVGFSGSTFALSTTTNHPVRLMPYTGGASIPYISFNSSGDFYPSAATVKLGITGTTGGFNAAYFTNGALTAAVKFDTYLRIGTTSAHSWQLIWGNAPVLNVNQAAFAPTTNAAMALGTTSLGYSAAHFSNDAGGTARGAIKYSSNTLQIGSTSAHNINFLRGDNPIVGLSATMWYPTTTGTIYIGDGTNCWKGVYVSNDASNTARGAIKYSTNTLAIGSTSDHAVSLIQNDTARIRFTTDDYVVQKAPATEITFASMGANEISFYLDETGGSEKLMVRVKTSGSATFVGELALAADAD